MPSVCSVIALVIFVSDVTCLRVYIQEEKRGIVRIHLSKTVLPAQYNSFTLIISLLAATLVTIVFLHLRVNTVFVHITPKVLFNREDLT